MRPILIGQAPSRSTDGMAPFSGKSGDRLQRLLGATMVLREVLDLVNLLPRWPGYTRGNGSPAFAKAGRRRHGGDHFPWREGRRAAAAMLPLLRDRDVLFAGLKVAECFGYRAPLEPLVWHMMLVDERAHSRVAVFPHPSAVSHWWNDPENAARASRFLRVTCLSGMPVREDEQRAEMEIMETIDKAVRKETRS